MSMSCLFMSGNTILLLLQKMRTVMELSSDVWTELDSLALSKLRFAGGEECSDNNNKNNDTSLACRKLKLQGQVTNDMIKSPSSTPHPRANRDESCFCDKSSEVRMTH